MGQPRPVSGPGGGTQPAAQATACSSGHPESLWRHQKQTPHKRPNPWWQASLTPSQVRRLLQSSSAHRVCGLARPPMSTAYLPMEEAWGPGTRGRPSREVGRGQLPEGTLPSRTALVCRLRTRRLHTPPPPPAHSAPCPRQPGLLPQFPGEDAPSAERGGARSPCRQHKDLGLV